MMSGRVLSRTLSRLAILCIVACLPVRFAMAEMLDQAQIQQNGSQDIDASSILAQTFTPSANGLLSRVEVEIQDNGSSSPWTLSIVDTSGGVPSGATLGSVVSSDHSGWVSVSLESQNISLLAGHKYGITLQSQQSSGVPNGWCTAFDSDNTNPTDLYTGGASWRKMTGGNWSYDNSIFTDPLVIATADRAFRTYVTNPVPEPSSLALFSAAGLAFVALRIRRQRKAAESV